MSRRPAATSGATPATTALRRAGVDFTTHPYEHDPTVPSYGREAAEALGVPTEVVFKTLLIRLEGAGLAVTVIPVDHQLDLKAAAGALGAKRAAMADPTHAERATGYVVGGISPVGQRRALPTVVDASALGHAAIYVSGGRRGFDIRLSPTDLVTVTGATVTSITR